LDAEMGFIADEREVMDMLTRSIKYIVKEVEENNKQELELHKVTLPSVPETIPAIKLSEIKNIIKKEFGYEVPKDTDIDPQGEVYACEYAKKKYNSDFIFLTHYPREFRPFYIMPDDENPKETKSFDLLFRGIEIATGGQRIHDYNQLVKSMKLFHLNPDDFAFYLEAFKYAMPAHGGWGMGLERIVYKLLNLSSVKEAVLFPRDVKRLIP